MQLEVLVNRPEVSALLQSNLAVIPWCETFSIAVNLCIFQELVVKVGGGKGDTAWMHTTLCA